jgi:hypothetical protein
MPVDLRGAGARRGARGQGKDCYWDGLEHFTRDVHLLRSHLKLTTNVTTNEVIMLQDLIDRLEKTTEPDHDLDERIERWLHKLSGALGRILLPYGLQPYTSSLDKAITLVPKDHTWGLGTRDQKAWGVAGQKWPFWAECGNVDVCGVTPAIALCLAALKAHRELDDTQVRSSHL